MIGDSATDIKTARAAGLPVICVDFGYTDVPVDELGPDRVISHFDELDGGRRGADDGRWRPASADAGARRLLFPAFSIRTGVTLQDQSFARST